METCRACGCCKWRASISIRTAVAALHFFSQLAKAGSALGGLLALVGDRGGGRTRALLPVHGAGAVALGVGTVSGFTAVRARLPAPVTHVPWHALEAPDVLARLDAARAAQEQPPPPEEPAARPSRGLLRSVGEELRDPLTPVLAVGAAASAIVGSGWTRCSWPRS